MITLYASLILFRCVPINEPQSKLDFAVSVWARPGILPEAMTGSSSPGSSVQIATVERLFYAPDGAFLVISCPPCIHVWNAGTGQRVHQYPGSAAAVSSLGTLACANPNGEEVNVYELASAKPLANVSTGIDLPLNQLAYSPSGHSLIGAALDRAQNPDGLPSHAFLVKWDEHGNKVAIHSSSRYALQSIAFTPDGRLLSAGWEKEMLLKPAPPTLRDPETLEVIRRFKTYGDTDANAHFSADGRALAIGYAKGLVRFFKARSGKLLDQRPGHEAVFSSDCQRIALIGSRGVTILPVNLSLPLFHLFVYGPVIHACFSTKDARLLVTAGSDGQVMFWQEDRLLATLVHFGTADWAIWTPEGYHNGTARALQAVSCRLGKEVYSLSQFPDLLRPDLIETALAGKALPEPVYRVVP